MTPLDAFHAWMREQPTEAGTEIALSIEDMLMPRGTPMGDDPIGAVERWNALPSEDTTAIIGRAVSIRAVVEHLFGRRFTGDNWVLARYRATEMRERHVAKGNADLVAFHDEALRKHSGRRRMWRDIGISWRCFVAQHLDDERIEEWFLDQFDKRGPLKVR